MSKQVRTILTVVAAISSALGGLLLMANLAFVLIYPGPQSDDTIALFWWTGIVLLVSISTLVYLQRDNKAATLEKK